MAEDPYSILEAAPGSTAEQIKAAYHRAVLKCHPDAVPGDGQAALERFYRLTEAYRQVMRMHQPACGPQELARRKLGWLFVSQAGSGARGACPPADQPTALRVVRPTRDENITFVACWLLATAGGVAAGLLWMKYLMANRLADDLTAGDFLALYAVALGVCLAGSLATLALLVFSRQIVWLSLRLALRACRLLPAPKARLPAEDR